jgi:hypothetical protein
VLGEESGAKTIEITNVTFATTGQYVPGRPQEERLLVRTTTHSREVIDEKGVEATVTVEAWPLGADLAAKPLYAVNLDGIGATVEDNALLVVERGTEDVAWRSIYGLGTGAPLFDTFVPLLRFSLSRDVQTLRYVGFNVPPDDTRDERLRDSKVVGVLAYASPERVIRQLLRRRPGMIGFHDLNDDEPHYCLIRVCHRVRITGSRERCSARPALCTPGRYRDRDAIHVMSVMECDVARRQCRIQNTHIVVLKYDPMLRFLIDRNARLLRLCLNQQREQQRHKAKHDEF